MPVPDESLVRFRRVVTSALAELENRRQEVNDLNVFPVADGDTGDNMALTLRAVADELNGLNGKPLDGSGRDEIVSAVARAALLGARGNSGVILSQIVRGAAEELASRPGELVDPILVSAALAHAADAAYASVRDPAEGTMLSAVRAMSARVAHDLAHMDTAQARSRRHRRGAGRAAGGGARERARGGQGGGRARARAARRAARVGRRRRGRLRPDRDPGRLPRGPARRRRSAARAPVRARGAAPARARVVELPLLHQLRRHRREPRGRAASRRCSRTSATPSWSSATTARCACTSTPTSPTAPSRCSRARARCRASTSPTCTSRSPTAAPAWRATARRPSAPPAPSSRWPAARG